MDYRFEISLPNSSDFRCEIAIGGDQTFQQFHDKIVDVLNYDNSQMASFFTIDKMGNRGKEIALMDMATDEEESDTLVMDSTKISDIIKPGCLELEYVFDFFTNRYFRVEYAGEYVRDSSDVMPVCVFCDGDIPEQFSFDEGNDNWEFDKPEEEFDDEYDDSFMEEFGNDSYGDEDREDRGYDEEDFREDRYESLDDYIDRL
ncbi:MULTISPECIES: IS1096 element passenger TnpR family protein [Porphyromonadaceae]|uniref:Plasmid pRiA4b Orf3-like domain-containing protein n=1 Tax=Sanguibacteroides justesenii TaxID=1547597 RepID=A0A0C3RD96_9PORP|nr:MULTISPECIES: hypothetical protein [Porphyromonadaceae]KIO44171.1 hypothetical protein BA92_12410 [Sanguibacteroides justesenii]KIO47172.1 hypothetical protein IE90_00830 [Sanguibacteroides justesenii]MCR9012542.1 hypothetical protein [Gabonibacter chumensis]PXZ43802.1 hypothetical protein DMB45_07390 [Sanguibacteroides justesenii]